MSVHRDLGMNFKKFVVATGLSSQMVIAGLVGAVGSNILALSDTAFFLGIPLLLAAALVYNYMILSLFPEISPSKGGSNTEKIDTIEEKVDTVLSKMEDSDRINNEICSDGTKE